MKSFFSVCLAVIVTASLATVAFGETIFVLRRNTAATFSGVLEARDLATANVTKTYATDLVMPEGVCLSPDRSIIYVGANPSSSGNRVLRSYNVASGTLLNSVILATTVNNIRGLDTDSYGNIYAAMNDGYIARITPDFNTVTYQWGLPLVAIKAWSDLEIVGNKLYAGGIAATSYGVAVWNLPDGGNGQWVGNTFGSRADGLAFAPDGTLYTADANTGIIKKWTGPSYTTSTDLVNLGPSTMDFDYVDGYLYVTQMLTAADPKSGVIKKVNLSTLAVTDWKTFPGGGADTKVYPRWLESDWVVPEPSALALLATGLIGLLCYVWRKRK